MQREDCLGRGDDGVWVYMMSRRGGTGRAACSHGQLHAQPVSKVTLANKELGSARNDLETGTWKMLS